jgi:hypothetical protein
MVPVPDDHHTLLNELQLRALRQIETFSWKLQFIRRPLFQEPVAGIVNPDGDKFATLERDGRISLLPDSAIRREDKTRQKQATQAAAPEPPSVAKKHSG